MTTEELNAALNIAKKIKRLQAQLDDIHITGIPGSTGGNSPVQGGSKLSAAVVAAELTSEIESLQDKLRLEQAIIARYIGKKDLEVVERRLLMLRYVKCLEWGNVARCLGYSLSHTFRLHQQLEKMIVDES
ncbi:MAG: hypothetical protein VB100_01790 [Angelakisella sp.]|nr:hypothetical protein [Angelakisella sp.]